ncbi:hypothetical protein [Glycomyces sp. YM15]|uniref:hypothetical protein n=1 Tax=Glycomyces sp. YM15 TaxID=2800446 RepID=UPI001966AD6E|nr:hypothetical protein [Glycomyces sp. YM15]
MPAEIREPLSVVFTLPGGVIYERKLHDLPDQQFAADLAAGLAAATHPHGPIRTWSVASKYVAMMRRMARDLHADGFTGGFGDLTPARVVQYWLACTYHRERTIRVVFDAFNREGGSLHPGIRAHLDGRRINKIVKSTPNEPYSDAEWQRLAAACTETINADQLAQRQALQSAERGSDPALHGISTDNLAWLAIHKGPAPTAKLLESAGLKFDGRGRRYGPLHRELRELHRALFGDRRAAFAYNVLFAMRSGIVPDGIDKLTTVDLHRTGEHTALLSYAKGRTSAESMNLPRNALRLLDQWLKRSELLRGRAGDLADQFWIHLLPGITRSWINAAPRKQQMRREWPLEAGLTSDQGDPLPIHGGRIRATYQHRRDRSNWTGRTTIDPNHTPQVEGDHYLSFHTPAQMDAIEGVIEQAQADLLRKAEPPVVMTGEDAARFAGEFPRLVEAAGLDIDAVKALLAGEQDVFVAACASPLNSPHAPAGTPCPARPWVCLLCPLAAFAPRHLPNLLRLKDFFSRQAMQMTTAQFMAVFGPYAARLDEDVLPRFGSAAIAAAAETAALPLHLEEMPR